jgi:hypothetical protein
VFAFASLTLAILAIQGSHDIHTRQTGHLRFHGKLSHLAGHYVAIFSATIRAVFGAADLQI